MSYVLSFRWLVMLALLAVEANRPAESPSIAFTKDSLEVVKKNLAAKKAALVDVRTVEEWNAGHLAAASSLPIALLQKPRFDREKLTKLLPPKKEKKIIYTHCVVGMRAKQAALVLEREGYIVRPLKPGYEELLKAGFARAKSKPQDEPASKP